MKKSWCYDSNLNAPDNTIIEPGKNITLRKQKDPAVILYSAAFLMAFTLGTWWVAVPFILKRLGGSEADVGNVFAAQMGCYALGCMIAGTLLGHFHPRRILLLGVPAMTLLASAMCSVLLWPLPKNFPLNPVGSLIILFGFTGMFMSFFGHSLWHGFRPVTRAAT